MCAPLFDSAYLDHLQEQWQKGYFLKNNRKSKDVLKDFVTTEWRSAREISKEAGITYKSAAKILCAMYMIGYVVRKEDNWVDSRYRKRKRFVYKRDNSADAVSILSNIFGLSVKQDSVNLAGHITRHVME